MNREISERLREVAELLSAQGASPFRVGAYRRAADTIAGLDKDVREVVLASGAGGLVALPGIDRALAGAILELTRTGRLGLLDRLRGTLDAERLFCTLPGVGPTLAREIHEALHVDTLEALETAAWDGRLAAVPGIGARRVQALRLALAGVLGRARGLSGPDAPSTAAAPEPPVALLLDVDAEYRRRAAAGELRRIAPRRFNPEGRAWLPILHTERDRWHFTALFSNTARAHQLGRTDDWVIVTFADDGHHDRQRTHVTENHGPERGRRVVRGREAECSHLLLEGTALEHAGTSR
ncbi:MAG TPA: helix-hairpin-helix domain-containing protein [Polyangia bacterium]